MEVLIEKVKDNNSYEITIRCREIPLSLIEVLNNLQKDTFLPGYTREGGVNHVSIKSILYFETVDKKVFFYTDDQIFSSNQKLYQLETLLINDSFIRVSKQAIVNLHKVKNISSYNGARLLLTLINDEKIVVTRGFVSLLKERLNL